MISQVNNSHTQAVKDIKRDSMAPLVQFHGHVVKTFSPLPQEGKLFEIVKRIILVVISPFVYLTLALMGMLGRIFTATDAKQGQTHTGGTSLVGHHNYQGLNVNNQSSKVSASSQAHLESLSGKKTSQPGLKTPKSKVSNQNTANASTSSTGKNKNNAIVEIPNNKESISDELQKTTYNLYKTLLIVNDSKYSLHSTAWNNYIFLIKEEMKIAINRTTEILNSFVSLESKLKSYWKIIPLVLSKKHPEILDKLAIPKISLEGTSNMILWDKFTTWIFHINGNLNGIQSNEDFFKQFQLLYGDKGLLFNQVFKNLESIYENNLNEFQNLSKSGSEFFKSFDGHISDDAIKALDKKKVSLKETLDNFKESLDKLKVKVEGFKLVNNDFEKIMELA